MISLQVFNRNYNRLHIKHAFFKLQLPWILQQEKKLIKFL